MQLMCIQGCLISRRRMLMQNLATSVEGHLNMKLAIVSVLKGSPYELNVHTILTNERKSNQRASH